MINCIVTLVTHKSQLWFCDIAFFDNYFTAYIILSKCQINDGRRNQAIAQTYSIMYLYIYEISSYNIISRDIIFLTS